MSARRLSPLRKGRGLKKVEVVGGRFHTFLCERKNILFLLRVLSMYLTSYDLHFPVFRAFLPFLVEVWWRSVEVICKPFSAREKFLAVFTVRLPNPSYTAPAVVSHTASADKRSDSSSLQRANLHSTPMYKAAVCWGRRRGNSGQERQSAAPYLCPGNILLPVSCGRIRGDL